LRSAWSPIARGVARGLVVAAMASPAVAGGQGADTTRRDTAGRTARPAQADTAATQPMAGMSGMAGMAGMSAGGMTGMTVDTMEAPSGRMILPMMKRPMIPGLEGVRPGAGALVPGAGRDVRQLPSAAPSADLRVRDGDTVAIAAGLVRRTIAGRTLAMYAFNGEAPGPLIRVRQGSTFFVRLRNDLDRPITIHWHGVRLDNAADGSPGMTQPPVAPGASFLYAVHCPDAGVFWYHDHVREDIGQPMGLYGNLYVEPPEAGARPSGPARREAFLILSDLLMDGDSVVPYGREAPNFALMGRFGNILLVNGEPRWHLQAVPGEVVRLLLTNAASARTYNISFGDAPIKLIASDQGRYAREVMVSSVVIAPGERYVADVRFEKPGDVIVVNQVQTIDHFLGEIYSDVDTMGRVSVVGRAASAADPSFTTLHDDSAVVRDIARFRPAFDKAPDEEIVLTTAIQGLPIPVMQFMSIDTMYRAPLEWTDGMSDMNWIATGKEVRWVIRDVRSGAENMKIDWRFHTGDVIKLRIFNDPRSLHPMNHPIHLHGQRFLVVARDGRPNPYLVWKDTATIPVGSTVDLVVDLSNPGTWMLHCHIGEHVESGMMAPLRVSAN
jgi:suppressor of ftsI